MGGEARYEDYLFLQLMERGWNHRGDSHSSALDLPSHRALLALLYWTYFETRIERLVRLGLGGVPENLASDILDRYSSITARLTQLYKLLFGTTYQRDLTELGAKSI